MSYSIHKPLYILVILLLLGAKYGTAQDAEARYEPSECPFKDADEITEVECGYLIVPENRDRPNGRMLRLAVAVIQSLSNTPEPDPLVFLSGGPGAGAIGNPKDRLQSPFWNAIRQNRALVFMDQRGTGYSDPAFCPELGVVMNTSGFRGLSPERQLELRTEAAIACRDQMLGKGLDFSVYNSATSARDFDDLRRLLGIENWNLLGVSYGTRLALTIMRDTPEGIRSVILDSVLPPNLGAWSGRGDRFMRSLRLVFDQCMADDACRRAFPTLEDDLFTVLDSLEKRPVVLAMQDTTLFPGGRLVIDGALLANGVFQGLYSRYFISVMPLLIREVKARNENVMKAVAEGLVQNPNALNTGLRLSIECYEFAPSTPPDSLEADQARHPRLHAWYDADDRSEICEVWHKVRADSTEFEPVRSDIPTLILAGEFDPITPPSNGRLAAETLSSSTFVEIPGVGHGEVPFAECTRNMIISFLDHPMEALDTSCVDDLPRASFVTDVLLKSGIYRLISRLQQGANLFLLGGLGLIVVLLLSAVLVWPIGYLIRRTRQKSREFTRMQRLARWLGWFTCVLALSFLGGFGLVIRQTVVENPFLLAFGIPADVGWLFYLPWIVLVLAAGVIVLSILAWKRKWWTKQSRIHYALVAAACMGFVLFTGIWGLM